MQKILPTTTVGSYPQPAWLVDHDALRNQGVPRIHAPEIWRISPQFLEAAQDDATLVAIRDMERAGIDIVTDGEIRRESYSNRFALSLDGIDAENPAPVPNRSGGIVLVPRITGPIRRRAPVEVRDMQFLRANTDRGAKITLPGPFTMTQQAKNEYYADEEEAAMAYAAAVNEEAHDLIAGGADVIQFDEPWMQARPEAARRYAVRAINRALQGLPDTTVIHMCFGYAAMVADKPTAGYSFLPQLADTTAGAISIEGGAAEARPWRAAGSVEQDDSAGRAGSGLDGSGNGRGGRRPAPRRAAIPPGREARGGAGLRHEVLTSGPGFRQAEGHGGRGRDRAPGACCVAFSLAASGLF